MYSGPKSNRPDIVVMIMYLYTMALRVDTEFILYFLPFIPNNRLKNCPLK